MDLGSGAVENCSKTTLRSVLFRNAKLEVGHASVCFGNYKTVQLHSVIIFFSKSNTIIK